MYDLFGAYAKTVGIAAIEKRLTDPSSILLQKKLRAEKTSSPKI